MIGIHGIDISKWNGRLDNLLDKLDDPPAFIYIKATEGVGYEDPLWRTNSAIARAQGIPFGAYHFARPGSKERPYGGARAGRQEAMWHASIADIGNPTLPSLLDWETYPGKTQWNNRAWIKAWIDTVRSSMPRSPIIYSGRNVWKFTCGAWKPRDTDLMIVKYDTLGDEGASAPTIPGLPEWKPKIWQWSGGGDFDFVPEDGIELDYDLFCGTEEEFFQWISGDKEPEDRPWWEPFLGLLQRSA